MSRTLLFTIPIGDRPAVPVYVDPELERDGVPIRGIAGDDYIVLREWALDVLVHEILHVALRPVLAGPTPIERYEISNEGHWIVVPAELALAPLIHFLAAEDRARTPTRQPCDPATVAEHATPTEENAS